MAGNSIEDKEASYLILINDQHQHSLWPADLEVPDGWQVALGPSTREECMDYVAANRTDTQPADVAGEA